jgi:hypothetical protein
MKIIFIVSISLSDVAFDQVAQETPIISNIQQIRIIQNNRHINRLVISIEPPSVREMSPCNIDKTKSKGKPPGSFCPAGIIFVCV